MSNPLEIACDESGHTGPDLLHVDQRYFGYASVALSDQDAWEIIEACRRKFKIQMPELKGSRLMKSANGRRLITEMIEAVNGQFAVNIHDKLLALCGWIFEYIYEPVYKLDPALLYQKNLHRFVAMFSWLWFNEAGEEASQTIRQFQNYMRTRKADDAPLLFKRFDAPIEEKSNEHPFDLIRRFAFGYKDIIIQDNARLNTETPDNGRWVLDLSASSLWSHLNYWGRRDRPLQIKCDVSKPLQAIAANFLGDENDPAIRRARSFGNETPLGWRLENPIKFVDSRNSPAVQIADVIAGAAVFLFSKPVPSGAEPIVEFIQQNMLQDTILPDPEVVDLEQRAPAVNYLMLFDLAQRAVRHADPYKNLAETYHAAEVSWSSGDFRPNIDR